MSDIVYAKANGVLAHGGYRVTVRAGEPWDANDPLVQHYPDSFAEHLPAVRSTQDPRGYREYEPVERATRAPGERRRTRRQAEDADSE